MPGSRCQHRTNSVASMWVLCLIMLSQDWFLFCLPCLHVCLFTCFSYLIDTLCIHYSFQFGTFMGFLSVWTCVFLHLFIFFVLFFGCFHILINLLFISLYFILLLLIRCLLRRDRKGVNSDVRGGGKELGVTRRWETLIRIYWMKTIL